MLSDARGCKINKEAPAVGVGLALATLPVLSVFCGRQSSCKYAIFQLAHKSNDQGIMCMSSSDDEAVKMLTIGENGSTDDEAYSGNVFLQGTESESRINTKSCFSYPQVHPDCSLTILEDVTHGVGGRTWEAAECLMQYLVDTKPLAAQSLVVELGAGTGVVGFLAAILLEQTSKVVVTDLDVMLKMMQLNLQHNQNTLDKLNAAKVHVAELWWGMQVPAELLQPDVILVADCVYLEDNFVPLLKTMWEMSGNDTVIYFSYKKRWRSSKRFFAKAKKLFSLTVDDPREKENAKQGLYIYTMRKLPVLIDVSQSTQMPRHTRILS